MPSCPVCGDDFPAGIGELRFQRHVNRCLDGVADTEPIILPPSPSSSSAPQRMRPVASTSLLSMDDDSVASAAEDAQLVGLRRAPELSTNELELQPSPSPAVLATFCGKRRQDEPRVSEADVAVALDTSSTTPEKRTTALAQHDSSADFFAAVAENVAYIGELFPDVPSATVEELLVATGNSRELTVSLLCDSSEVQSQQLGGELHSALNDAASASGSRQRRMRKVLSSQYLQGMTSQLSRQGHTFHAARTATGDDDESVDDDNAARTSSSPPPSALEATARVASSPSQSSAGPQASMKPASAAPQSPQQPPSSVVELVVYDLQPNRTIAKRIGLGAYHSGVVVYKHEFSFGGSRNLKRDSGKSGIWSTRSLYRTATVVKKRLVLGRTFFTPQEIRATLKAWGSSAWRVDDYHLLSKNCNHFADVFLKFLAEKSVLLADAGHSPSRGTTGEEIRVGANVESELRQSTAASPPGFLLTANQPNLSGGGKPFVVSAAMGPATSGKLAPAVNVPAGATPLISYSPSSLQPVGGSISMATTLHTHPHAIGAASSPSTGHVMALPTTTTTITTAVDCAALPSSSSSQLISCPTFPLPAHVQQAVREAFQLPSWVNRAAKLGDAVIPDFVLKKVLDALMPPVPDEEEPETPPSGAAATEAAVEERRLVREKGSSRAAVTKVSARRPAVDLEETERSAKPESLEAVQLIKSVLDIDSDEVCRELLQANDGNAEQAILAFFSAKQTHVKS